MLDSTNWSIKKTGGGGGKSKGWQERRSENQVAMNARKLSWVGALVAPRQSHQPPSPQLLLASFCFSNFFSSVRLIGGFASPIFPPLLKCPFLNATSAHRHLLRNRVIVAERAPSSPHCDYSFVAGYWLINPPERRG